MVNIAYTTIEVGIDGYYYTEDFNIEYCFVDFDSYSDRSYYMS